MSDAWKTSPMDALKTDSFSQVGYGGVIPVRGSGSASTDASHHPLGHEALGRGARFRPTSFWQAHSTAPTPAEWAIALRVLQAATQRLNNTYQEEIKYDDLNYWWNRARGFAAIAAFCRCRCELPCACTAGQGSSRRIDHHGRRSSRCGYVEESRGGCFGHRSSCRGFPDSE